MTGAREDLWGIPLFRGNIGILEKKIETAALLGMWVVGKIMVLFWVPYT